MPLIPDTLEGALLLSLIDFLLSFVIISFIGIVLAGFPWLNRAGHWVTQRWLAPATIPATPSGKSVADPKTVKAATDTPTRLADTDIPLEDVAAISAVLTALLGEHRILHLTQQQRGTEWLAAGRQAQHHSHAPPPRHGAR